MASKRGLLAVVDKKCIKCDELLTPRNWVISRKIRKTYICTKCKPLPERASWTAEEVTYLKTNYLKIPTEDIVDHLNRSSREIYSAAKNMGLTHIPIMRTCDICGTKFNVRERHPNRWREVRYCSTECAKKGGIHTTLEWRNINREHCRNYQAEYHKNVWGTSNRLIARNAELLACNVVLPALGFTEIKDVTTFGPQTPFDIVAKSPIGQRVLIDVTTTRGKRGTANAKSLAEALGMKLFFLFIRPDLEAYMLRDADDGNNVKIPLLRRV